MLLLTSAWGVATLQTVGAPIRKPSLDWWQEGKTFSYLVENDTESFEFNTTITNLDGPTNTEATWSFWRLHNETKETFLTRHQAKNRTDLNFTGFSTHLWVNETNVLDGSARIGDKVYELLESTTDYYKFGNETRLFYFDAAKGWLIKASYPSTGTTVTMIGDRQDDAPPEQAGIDDRNCTVPIEHSLEARAKEEYAEDETVESYVQLCVWPNDESSDSDDCDVEAYGAVDVKFRTLDLFDYEYEIDLPGSQWDKSGDYDDVSLLFPWYRRRSDTDVATVDGGIELSPSATITNRHSCLHVVGGCEDWVSTSVSITC